MVDVDDLYQTLILHLRPWADDPQTAVDSIMPTVLLALNNAWEEGRGHGLTEWAVDDLPGNPFGSDHYPDWTRPTSADG